MRACERWMASSIIAGVAVTGFFAPGAGAAITPALDAELPVAVWAAAGEATEVKASAPAAPAPMRVKIALRFFIVFSCIGR